MTTIARVMEGQGQHAIVTCAASALVRQAAELLSGRRIGALPVLDGASLVGIFSERDLLHAIAQNGPAALDHAVQNVMTSPPITVEPRTPVMEALSLMTRRRVRHLPVMDGPALAGFVSIGDLVKYRIEAVEEEAEQMRAYIQSA